MSAQAQEATRSEVSDYQPGERSLNEIVADLRKPIPDRHLKSKRKGNTDLVFLPWYRAVKYLDWYAPGWSYEIRNVYEIGGKLVMTVRISVPCSDGVYFREASGQEDEDVNSFGDSSSNAESMALRRAASKLGLGLYLYDKGQ
jgi:hypothetical protein